MTAKELGVVKIDCFIYDFENMYVSLDKSHPNAKHYCNFPTKLIWSYTFLKEGELAWYNRNLREFGEANHLDTNRTIGGPPRHLEIVTAAYNRWAQAKADEILCSHDGMADMVDLKPTA